MDVQNTSTQRRFPRLKFEKRKTKLTLSVHLTALSLALVMALIACSAIFWAAGASPIDAFSNLGYGAFGNLENTLETLVRATPLILTGLATTIAFRAKIWNIGQEGQFFAGAMFAYWGSLYMASLPGLISFPLIVMCGFAGGAICGGFAGFLKVRFGVNEVITTVMSNYIIFYLLTFLLSGPWTEPGAFYQQTARIDAALRFPTIFDASRLHSGFIIGLAVAVFMHIMLTKMPIGYQIRAFGENPKTSRFKGIAVGKIVVLVMLMSGGIAGLAGASELFGLQFRLKTDISGNFGFTGIVIAMLGGLRPGGVVLAAILFGGLASGSFAMQVLTGVPTSVVYAIQSILLLFFLCSSVLAQFQIKVVKTDG